MYYEKKQIEITDKLVFLVNINKILAKKTKNNRYFDGNFLIT